MKRSLNSTSCCAAAILAGGLFFTGPASAAVILSETFEGGGGAGNTFSMPIYTYAQGYTQANGLTPGGGTTYATGGSAPEILYSSGAARTILTGGITAAGIDAGLATYDFSAQFSAYLTQGDNSAVEVSFRDGADSPLGSLVVFGGQAFSAALPRDGGGNAAWATDSRTGTVPAGARSVAVSIRATRFEGSSIDGYVDNVLIQVVPVPEPTAAALAGAGALLLLRRRKRP